MNHWFGMVLLLVILAGCSSVPRTFEQADPMAPDRVSHETWGRIVQAHVHDGHVDYPAIQADGRLNAYLSELNRIDPTRLLRRQDQLAFWINAYNAFAVQGILDFYSPMTPGGAIAISSAGSIGSAARQSIYTISNGRC